MTVEEMQQITLDHWLSHFRKDALKLGKAGLAKQSLACARLTRREMDDLKLIGIDEDTAWSEARSLYCLTPPPRA